MNQPALSTAPNAGVPLAVKKPALDMRVKAAGVLFVTSHGDALFLRRSEEAKHPGEWDLPGGGVDEGETAECGARRETMEEIGLDPGDEIVPIDAQADEEGVDYTTFLLHCERFVPQLNPNEHDDYRWAQIENAPEPLHPGLARTLHAQKHLAELGEDDSFLPRREGTHLPRPSIGHPHMEPLPKPGPHTSTNVKNYDEGAPILVDREHDGPWMSVISKDGRTVYVNKNLPHYVDIAGTAVDVDAILCAHEEPEWVLMQERLAALGGAEVSDAERTGVYEHAHERGGIPGERAYAEKMNVNWDKWNAWCRGVEAKLEKGPFDNEPDDAHVRPVPHRHGELMAATDSALALALDKDSVRAVDVDGRMHVGMSNISKANVCPYRGREIPDWEEMGLDAETIYQLLRDPDELRKAAPSFNRVQLLRRHVPVSADDHRPYDVIGTTGDQAVFEPPYLRNSLTIWEQDAIDAVKAGDKRELSCGYHYRADMTPGLFQGEVYDGVMRDIIGNHVALVEDGRAGPDVVVGDSTETLFRAIIREGESLGDGAMSGKKTALPTKFANLALQLTARAIRPILAQDAKLNLMPLFADLNSKNFPTRKAALVKALEKETKGKLAKDASLSHVTELLDHLEHPTSDESVSGAQHRAMAAAAGGQSTLGIPKDVGSEFMDADRGRSFADELPEFLRGKGLDEESIKAACDMAFGSRTKDEMPEQLKQKSEESEKRGEESGEGANDDEDDDEKEKKAEDEDDDEEEEEKKEGKDSMPAHEKVSTPAAHDKKPAFDQKAFDAALDAAKKEIRTEVRENERRIRLALDEVRPYVGELRGGEYETPKQVYRATLKMLGMDAKEIEELNLAGMKIVLKQIRKPGARPAGGEERLGVDAASDKDDSYDKMFPDAARIGIG